MNRYNWRNKGWTAMPNLLMSKAIPLHVRATGMALHARAFRNARSIKVRTDTIAEDLGVSRQTVQKHLNVLETMGLIRRIRRGQGKCNIIVLNLKAQADRLRDAIGRALPDMKDALFDDTKRTTAWWIERWRANKQAMAITRGMRAAA